MVVKIKFDRSIRREFKEQYGGLFEQNVVKSIASIDGKTTEYHFDFGDADAQGLANDILQVYKAADSCMRNLRIKRDMDYVSKALATANKLVPMEETEMTYKRVTGQWLIDNRYAMRYATKAPEKQWYKRLFDLLFCNNLLKFEYIFCNQIVDTDAEYVVLLNQPQQLKEPRQMDHQRNVLLAYDYGEQIHSGYGIVLVERYYNQIIDIHNNYVKQQEDESERKTDMVGVPEKDG